ncbi:MAG: hypothetical protein HAW62_01480 [Endozoicomonadaceae bacterium]|nr:hypothetical protein [Endozoicomonadaceae bacterium]
MPSLSNIFSGLSLFSLFHPDLIKEITVPKSNQYIARPVTLKQAFLQGLGENSIFSVDSTDPVHKQEKKST